MGKILEKLGLQKNPKEVEEEQRRKEKLEYLRNLVESLERNLHKLENIIEAGANVKHPVETRDQSATRSAIEYSKEKIIEVAGELGLDGHKIISETERKVVQLRTNSRAD